MIKMAKCTFCGIKIEQGTGKIYVEKSGKMLNFCSSKCEKNQLKLKRKGLTTKWTRSYRKTKQTAEEEKASADKEDADNA